MVLIIYTYFVKISINIEQVMYMDEIIRENAGKGRGGDLRR